jgi:UDP-GlcNAc:undecaprenyl-phosphate GlcNAc-1-phosphate transferase
MLLSSIAALIVASLAAWVLTPIIRVAARRRGLLDEPGERKIHGVAIPRLGGVAILVAFYLGVSAGLVVETIAGGERASRDQIAVVLLGAALVACIGLLDDLVGMRARVKLAAQIGASLVVVLLGLSIDHLAGPWGSIPLGAWSLPLTVAWFVVVMNAMNLIDGLDGLASGVALIAMAAFYLISTTGGLAPPIALVLAAAGGGVIGFLRYNLYPATIIMGDTGAILLGFLLAAAGVAITQSGSPAAAWAPVAALALALGDTAWAIVRRVANRTPIFAPDKRHVHHRLLAAGLSQRTTMLTLWLVAAAFALIAVVTAR